MMKQSEKEQQSQVVKPDCGFIFQSPRQVLKDNIRGVQLLFDSFARQITSYFSGIFRVAIQANLNSVDQLTFSEFAQGLTNPCCVAVLNWQSLPSSVLINLSPKIALPIVDRLCGGEGNTPIVSRVLTDIESALLKKIAQGMADILSDTMYEYRLGRHLLTVTSFEVNPLFIQQAFAPNDIVLSVVMVFKFGANSGNIEFCLPMFCWNQFCRHCRLIGGFHARTKWKKTAIPMGFLRLWKMLKSLFHVGWGKPLF